jgi:hypothetical protein
MGLPLSGVDLDLRMIRNLEVNGLKIPTLAKRRKDGDPIQNSDKVATSGQEVAWHPVVMESAF